MRFTEDHVRYFVDHNTRWSNLPFLKLCGTLQSTLADKNFAVSYVWFVIQHTNRTTTFEDPRPGGAKEGPKGAYGVPAQYERSFRWNCTFTIWLVRSNPVSDLPTLRWKLSQFRYLCQSNALPSHIKVRFQIRLTNFQMLSPSVKCIFSYHVRFPPQLSVSRQSLFEDSFHQIMRLPAYELRRRLYIIFRQGSRRWWCYCYCTMKIWSKRDPIGGFFTYFEPPPQCVKNHLFWQPIASLKEVFHHCIGCLLTMIAHQLSTIQLWQGCCQWLHTNLI